MTPLQAAILGLVEGITEYLPVSSTGHLIITSWLLGLDQPPERKHAVDAFLVILQGGAILAVLGLYRARVAQMLRGLVGRDAIGLRLFVNLLIAFAPAAVLGVLLDDAIARRLFHPWPVIIALFLGGLLLLGIRRWQERVFARDARRAGDDGPSIDSLTRRQALFIGALQCVAMVPGTSRSMMSIVGGMFVGLRPREAAEFSFLLGLPTLGGACVYKLVKTMRHDGFAFVDALGGWTPIIVGLAVATISAALAITWLVGYLSRHGMAIFGWYRVALAIVLAVMVWRSGLAFGG